MTERLEDIEKRIAPKAVADAIWDGEVDYDELSFDERMLVIEPLKVAALNRRLDRVSIRKE